jgi:hypothetical protein
MKSPSPVAITRHGNVVSDADEVQSPLLSGVPVPSQNHEAQEKIGRFKLSSRLDEQTCPVTGFLLSSSMSLNASSFTEFAGNPEAIKNNTPACGRNAHVTKTQMQPEF